MTRAGLWADDSCIDLLLVRRGEVVKGGQVLVKVGPLTDGPVSAEVATWSRPRHSLELLGKPAQNDK